MTIAESWPRICVVTPSFNQARFLDDTIQSILAQNYPNLEYMVIDGGSSDGSVDILKKYDGRIDYWVSEPDRGQAHAINKGFARARGDIFAWLNSDDTYQPGVLHQVARQFQSCPRADVISGRCRLWQGNADDILLDPSPLRTYADFLRIGSNWMNGRLIVQPEAFFRRSAFQQFGPLKEQLTYCFDVCLWINMARAGRCFQSVDCHWANLRMHSKQKTHDLSAAYTELAAMTWDYLQSDWTLLGEAAHLIADDIFQAMKHIRDRDKMRLDAIERSTSYRLGRVVTRAKFW